MMMKKSKATTKSTTKNGKVTISSKATGKKIVSFKEGGLHKSLGVPEGQKIPAAKMAAAKKSKNPLIRKQVGLAKALKKMRTGKKK